VTRREVGGLLVFAVLSIVPANEKDSEGKREEMRKMRREKKDTSFVFFFFFFFFY
jgi:hypothetical protein